jgi:hypothetical protein
VDSRGVAIGLSVGRAVLGGALLASPAKMASLWIGPEAELAGPQVVIRAMGARDVGLGLGALAALRVRRVRPWLAAGVLADATDLAATAMAGRALPPVGRAGTMALAAGGTVAGLALLRELR